MKSYLPFQAMSEEQLTALRARLSEDAALRKKLLAAGDLDSAVLLAREAGFHISKADLLKHQSQQTLELSDEELEGLAGGKGGTCIPEKKATTMPF